jgi:P-aminobenzoate N-oxygenase AurF
MLPELTIPALVEARLSRDYATIHPRIQRLHGEARQLQWDESYDIDWTTQAVTAPPPEQSDYGRAAFDNSALARYGESMWRSFRHEQQAWMVSQFIHGEQSSLIVSARLTEVLPDVAAKGYAASQSAEEARHLAAFTRYARERRSTLYPASLSFECLLEQILRSGPWDFLALGMQIMIESLALAAFRLANSTFEDPLIRRITHLVARDEARHVSFGVLLLEGLYPRMSAAELRCREEFVLEAAELLSRRYLLTEVWEHLGIDVDEGTEFARSNVMMQAYRRTIFARVVHTLERIGLMTPYVQEGFTRLGLLGPSARTRTMMAHP